MKTEPSSKDVYWIAKGCWEHFYNWKAHPATKPDWLVAIVTGACGLVVILATAFVYTANRAAGDLVGSATYDPIFFIGVILLLVGLAFFFKGQYHYNREKQDWTDHAVDRFENGDGALPSLESLKNWAPGFEKPKHEGV